MNDHFQISPNIPPYVIDRINDRCLNNAFDDYQATINLYDRNGHFTIAHEITTKGITQQEDILNYLESELSEDHNVILELQEAQLCSCPE